MDVLESKETSVKQSAVATSRPPLVLAEKNNENSCRSRTREISSRYRSPTAVASSGPRRCPSPSITRTVALPPQSVPKRAISAERKRPATPPSPPRPSTPVHDTSMETRSASRKLTANRMQEGLWPSTMCSLSNSFQSDAVPRPISKKEQSLPSALSDQALRPSSNVSQKLAVSRKPTPERKKSPLKGKSAPDQSENSKPVETLQARLVDQHRWPSRTGGRLPSSALTHSMDFTDKPANASMSANRGMDIFSLKKMSILEGSRSLQKSSGDGARLAFSNGCGNTEFGAHSRDNNRLCKPVSSILSGKMNTMTSGTRSQSLPTTPGVFRPSSPSKAPVSSFSLSRGASPSRTRVMNSTARGVSPSHSRPSSPSRQSSNSASVLSFIADIKRGKKAANHIGDAHQLRLLYNRHLQWRYANARANVSLRSQKLKAEKMLYNVWETTSELWDSVIEKRIELQQLRLRLKLHIILNEQMAYLDSWNSCESHHISSLTHTVEDLRASTLRLPVLGGARGDIGTMKAAIFSAVDVMQAMGSSMCSLLARVEGMNGLVSELADLATRERAMIGECEAIASSIATLQVEEYSLRTHLIQIKENLSIDS